MYLDGLPGTILEARYNDKIACYTKVFVVSKIRLEHHFCNAPVELWQEFMSKFNKILIYEDGGISSYTSDEYFNSLELLIENY